MEYGFCNEVSQLALDTIRIKLLNRILRILILLHLLQAMGWAYARGDHITKEHLFVYWLAPLEATVVSVWTFNLLFKPQKHQKQKQGKVEKGTKAD